MSNKREQYDFLIIGGGIFGIYAALYLAKHGLRTCIVEKEKELLKKASIVNQARLHSGYHYPRSVATALMSDDNKARFTADHQPFINSEFEKYYAIDRFGSFTDSLQFERFCEYLKIQCKPVLRHPLFNYHRLETLYSTIEYSFDPILIAEYYRQQLKQHTDKIEVQLYSRVEQAEARGGQWVVELSLLETGTRREVEARQVINATYAGSNAINRLFKVAEIDLMHEISEMAFVTSPQVKNLG